MNFVKGRESEGRGVSTEYEVIDVWQSSFSAFESKKDINNFLERYQKESNYFELLPNEMIVNTFYSMSVEIKSK